MEDRVQNELRGRDPAEVTSLTLDGTRAQSIAGITDKFASLRVLSLINVGLTTLDGFPSLPDLRKLDLSDNRLSGGLNNLSQCPLLATLILSGNRIKDLAALQPLAAMESLHALDLFENDVTQTDNYRLKIFELLPHLQYLDGEDRQGNELGEESADESEDEEDDENEEENDYETEGSGDGNDEEDDADSDEGEDEDEVQAGDDDEESESDESEAGPNKKARTS